MISHPCDQMYHKHRSSTVLSDLGAGPTAMKDRPVQSHALLLESRNCVLPVTPYHHRHIVTGESNEGAYASLQPVPSCARPVLVKRRLRRACAFRRLADKNVFAPASFTHKKSQSPRPQRTLYLALVDTTSNCKSLPRTDSMHQKIRV